MSTQCDSDEKSELKIVRPIGGELLCAGDTGHGEEEAVNPSEPTSSGSTALGPPDELESPDGAEEEAVVPKRMPNPRQPTKYEVEQHNLTHYPIQKLVSPLRLWEGDQ